MRKEVRFKYNFTNSNLYNLFSISEPAPVRLASLRAERAYNHWEGASHIMEARMCPSNAFDGQSGAVKKIGTRSKFKKQNFFI